MKLALFKKKVYCRDCEFFLDMNTKICSVTNEFTDTSVVYWRHLENWNGKCGYYKEKIVREKGHAF